MLTETMMKEALGARPDAVAIACMDTRSGLLLGLQVRGDIPRDDVEVAAFSAGQLCSAPLGDERIDGAERQLDESFVASEQWVHAFARVPSRRDLVVVGIAPGDANIALLRTWIREVAAHVGPEAPKGVGAGSRA
ncbi:MAG: hypothetical protein JWP97_2737 [Labilithrix sp.]|nr:hypothetical protein [Labilithrix sp.]